jgi:hypothetical protein
MAKVKIRTMRIYITWRRSLDDDVSIVIGTFREQLRKPCPRIVQFCLVVGSNNRDGGALTVVVNGDTP